MTTKMVTTKMVATILAAMWGLSTILAIIVIALVPVDIVWPTAAVDWDITFYHLFTPLD